MDVKITIGHSITLYKIIEKALFKNEETYEERELPFNVKYKLQRNMSLVAKDYAFWEAERNRLIKTYGGEPDANGKVTVKPENLDKFRNDLMDILNIEVSHNFLKLNPKDVDYFSDIKVALHEMDIFIALLVEDKDLVNDLNTPIGNTEAKNTEETEKAPEVTETEETPVE